MNMNSPSGWVMLGFVVIFAMPTLLASVVFQSIWPTLYMLTGLLLVSLFMFLNERKWVVKLIAACVPRLHAIQLMDFEGDITYTLVLGEWGKTLRGWSSWYFQLDKIILLPNGAIAGSYHYFWLPLSTEQQMIMRLTHEQVPDFEQLSHSDSWHRTQFRHQLIDSYKMSS